MNQMKRQLDDTIDENNNNKKQKLENEIKKSYFENLANETIYQIFEYLDVYHIYYAFFYFNNRLQNLILNSNFPIQIYVPPNISKTNFELYCNNMILPNRFRINYLHLSNPFTLDQLFSPPRLICEFIQLEILILEHIDTKYLSNIFRHLTTLSKFDFLKLSLADTIQEPGYLFMFIFRLPYLKSCQLTYQTKNGQQPSPIYFFEYRHSSIENLTINTPFPLNSLNNLFTCLPNLCYLSIDSLVGSHLTQMNSNNNQWRHLKHVSIKLDEISFLTLQQLANSYFHSVEIFYITIKNNSSYLHPQGWQELIEKLMPNLRIFDLNYIDGVRENSEWFHFFIFSFNSLFWKSKKWFFNHQHYYRDKEDHGILYSTNRYRRKNFIFYWETCKDNYDLNHEINNLNSVEYLEIYGTQATYCRDYFPNVTELKLGNYFKTSDKSISITLNHLLPLKQLKTLYISEFNFPFEEIINLLHSSPNLHTLKLDWLLVFQLNIKLLEQNQIFQSVIKINQIKYFHLDQTCTIDTFKFILKLSPQLEYLKIGMVTQQINDIFRYLFTQTNHRLRFLCFSQTPKRCLKELNILIKSENLLNNYSMKLLNRQLYLWW